MDWSRTTRDLLLVSARDGFTGRNSEIGICLDCWSERLPRLLLMSPMICMVVSFFGALNEM